MKVLSHEEEALEEPFRQEVGIIKRKYYGLARKIFDELTAEGANPGLNPRVAILSLFGMMNWVYQWHKPGVDPGAAELTDTIVGIFLQAQFLLRRGLATCPNPFRPPSIPNNQQPNSKRSSWRRERMATMSVDVKELIKYRVEDGVAILEMDDPPGKYLHLPDDVAARHRYSESTHGRKRARHRAARRW